MRFCRQISPVPRLHTFQAQRLFTIFIFIFISFTVQHVSSMSLNSTEMKLMKRDDLDLAVGCWQNTIPRGMGRPISDCAPGLEQSGYFLIPVFHRPNVIMRPALINVSYHTCIPTLWCAQRLSIYPIIHISQRYVAPGAYQQYRTNWSICYMSH
jgi:hypothetical protein